jgi:hypothetical protein
MALQFVTVASQAHDYALQAIHGDFPMKKEAKIRPFWYSDVWLFPKLITIITSLDEKGRINAAPYSHIMQYDVMAKNG